MKARSRPALPQFLRFCRGGSHGTEHKGIFVMSKKAITVTLTCLAALASMGAQAAGEAKNYPGTVFSIPENPEFMAAVGAKGEAPAPADMEKAKTDLEKIFDEKVSQHAMTKHAKKGLSCTSCHNEKESSGPAWMAAVTKPALKAKCGDCHTVQKSVFAKTDTHAKIDCVACHMPNMPSPEAYRGEEGIRQAYEAVRRAHLYKIEVDPKASSYVTVDEKQPDGSVRKVVKLAENKKGRGYVDIMWSCARATPGDYTIYGEAQGCHGKASSKLDEGLVYRDQSAVYAEIVRYQQTVKEGYDKVVKGVARLNQLLEVTKLTPADQTEVRLMLDKAIEIADQIKEDGSWGMHAPRYLKDRALAGAAYIDKAQSIIDNGGYVSASRRAAK